MHATRVVTRAALLSIFASAALADVDLNGLWSIAFGGFIPTTLSVQFSQSGTSLNTESGSFPAGCAGFHAELVQGARELSLRSLAPAGAGG